MSLVWIVYLIGVLPAFATGLGVIGGMGSFLLITAGVILTFMSNFMSCYSWDDKTEIESKKKACGMWGKRAFYSSILTLFIALLANLIPSEKTMYYMVGAYGTQKLIENPEAQALASDGVDILKQLMAKAKRELADDEPKKETKQ